MPKTKISVTVDASLVERLDRLNMDATRSEIVEMALEKWLRDARRQALEREIEKYYAGLTAREKAENDEWAELSAATLGGTWK